MRRNLRIWARQHETESPKAKNQVPSRDLRAALIECGLETIDRNGVHALTLREIGKQLGVSRSAVYRHFKGKANVLFAISEAGFIEFDNVVEAARKGAGDGFAAQMDAMAIAYARFADEHRAQFEMMFAALETPGGAADTAAGQNLRILEEIIRDAQKRGRGPSGRSSSSGALRSGSGPQREHAAHGWRQCGSPFHPL